MANKLTVFILDDSIHQSEEFIEKSIYNTKISSDNLGVLVNNFDWKGHQYLKLLISYIIKSEPALQKEITTYGFTNPAICLDEVDNGLKPDVIIYDWEYGSESPAKSSQWLKELLDDTDAFIFVYSHVRNEIPELLNKSEFNEYANRIQLFLKGDDKFSIFTSEEFIFKYIMSRVAKNDVLKINGKDIKFTDCGYLKNVNDILYLESIIGKSNLLLKLQDIKILNDEIIESLFENNKNHIYFDAERKFLITEDSNLFMTKFKPTRKMTYLEVVKKYGLETLKDVLDNGLTKIFI